MGTDGNSCVVCVGLTPQYSAGLSPWPLSLTVILTGAICLRNWAFL